jgi:hypothetical protein
MQKSLALSILYPAIRHLFYEPGAELSFDVTHICSFFTLCEIRAVIQSGCILTITAHAIVATAGCPSCGIFSQPIHRDYTRHLRDRPPWDYAVRLVLHVRRFRCLKATCTTQTFAERLPQVMR